MAERIQRRDVLRMSAAAGAGLAAREALSRPASAPPAKTIRVGFVGVGGRGTGLLRQLLRLEGVQVPALCDIKEANLARAQDLVVKAGQPRPEGYSRSETDFRRLCERTDLDLVMNATPWHWHTPIAVAAMTAGKDTATEIPAAQTLEECWQLVETSEKTGKQCIILENDCYYRDVLLVMNLLQKGLLGEPLYAEAGYMHDIRAVKFNTVPNGEPWRLDPTIKRNGNLYPSHPMGPLAWWMDINRGDRLSYLMSMSTKSRSMKDFAVKNFGAADPRAKTDYALGDINSTLVVTERGRVIHLVHDTNTPRVKEHMLRVQGTKGAFNCHMDRIFIEGRSNRGDSENWRGRHDWEATTEYRKQYDSKIWQTMEARSAGAGHGGIDFMLIYRVITNFQQGRPQDLDVYDAATWSAIVPLSEASVAKRSTPMDIPDFTRDRWQSRPRIDVDSIV